MGVVSHSCGEMVGVGMVAVGRACWTQPEGVGHISRNARKLPVCEVGALLTHERTDVKSNTCVAV